MARDYGSRHYRRKKTQSSSKNFSQIKWWMTTGVILGLVIALLAYFALKGNPLLKDLQSSSLSSSTTQMTRNSALPNHIMPKSVKNDVKNEPEFDFYNEKSQVKMHIPAKSSIPNSESVEHNESQLPSEVIDHVLDDHTSKSSSNLGDFLEPSNDLVIPTQPNLDRHKQLLQEKALIEKEIELATRQEKSIAPPSKKPIKQYILAAGSFKEYSAANQERAHLALQGFEFKIKLITNQEGLYRLWQGPYTIFKKAQEQQRILLKADIKTIIIPELDTND